MGNPPLRSRPRSRRTGRWANWERRRDGETCSPAPETSAFCGGNFVAGRRIIRSHGVRKTSVDNITSCLLLHRNFRIVLTAHPARQRMSPRFSFGSGRSTGCSPATTHGRRANAPSAVPAVACVLPLCDGGFTPMVTLPERRSKSLRSAATAARRRSVLVAAARCPRLRRPVRLDRGAGRGR
jgi:hypothetical protein